MQKDNQKFGSVMNQLGVTPLGDTGKVEHTRPKPLPSNIHSNADEKKVLEESMSEDPEHSTIQWDADEELCKPGLQNRDFIRLKKGRIARESETNIRGYTAVEANQMLENFLRDSVNSGYRCVKVIHGKGINSPDGVSIIKQNTQRTLTLNKFVLAYSRALPPDGGSGAKYILLKKKR